MSSAETLLGDEQDDLARLRAPRFPHGLDWLGGVAGVVPFFLSFWTSSTRSENGHVIEAVRRDYVALGGGGLALLAGALSLALVRSTPPAARARRLGASATLVALGLYQLAVRSGLLG